eukprot:scaffold213_cov94-Cylindrotheca_fusiformis.AAC.3
MLLELGHADSSSTVYERDFEGIFLPAKRLEEEKERAGALGLPMTTEGSLHRIIETEGSLHRIIETVLIEHHTKTIVDVEHSGFAALLKDDSKLEEMRRMYDLFVRERINKADGKALISDQEKGEANAPAFMQGQLRALRFMSTRNSELVGWKTATEEQIKDEVQKVIVVFRYLSDKDVFESFYRKHLAKRLLSGKYVSSDAERAMVSQLKAECGDQLTSELEGMLPQKKNDRNNN